MDARVNGYSFEAPTDHSARIMFDGALDDVRRAAPGEDRDDAFRYAADLAASLTKQGWLEIDDAHEKLARVGVLLGKPGDPQVKGIVLAAFADLIRPAEAEVDCAEADCLALARRDVAAAADKRAAFEWVAADLGEHVLAGHCTRREAGDTLQRIAEAHGLIQRLGQDSVQALISAGLQGRQSSINAIDNAALDRLAVETDAHDAEPLPLVQQLAPAEPYRLMLSGRCSVRQRKGLQTRYRRQSVSGAIHL